MSLLNLDQLSDRIAKVDEMFMLLAKRRMEYVAQVGAYKRTTGDPIFRSTVEDRRIRGMEELALKHGLNPHFARSLAYLLINEACKQQLIALEERVSKTEPPTEGEQYVVLRKNLLVLAERWCSTYDQDYDQGFFATRAYRTFEEALLLLEVDKLSERDLVLDLGCATGRLTLPLSGLFARAVGYDVSPHMLEVARENCRTLRLDSRVDFVEVDVEQGIPLETESASFVVMNLGTASDVRDIATVWREILRVLKPGGRFFLSFYNDQALLYRWELLPWPAGIVASLNRHQHYLQVHSGGELLAVYARPYTTEEVKVLLEGSTDLKVLTYPTVSAILPQDIFEDQVGVQDSIKTIDRALSSDDMGAYIIATGAKS